jgi:hypothetical protein
LLAQKKRTKEKGTQISLISHHTIDFTAQAKTRYAQTLARFTRKINNVMGAI